VPDGFDLVGGGLGYRVAQPDRFMKLYCDLLKVLIGVVGFVLNLKTEMAEGESAAVIGPTGLPASRVASPFRCNRCEPESHVEPSTTPSSSLSIPVSRLKAVGYQPIHSVFQNGTRLATEDFRGVSRRLSWGGFWGQGELLGTCAFGDWN
jgi:hypothetical protein